MCRVLAVGKPQGSRANHMSEFLRRIRPPSASYSSSKRPWSLFIGLFTILALLGPLLPFLFGRIMIIDTFVRVRAKDSQLRSSLLILEQNKRETYREILIAGDLSQEDVNNATNQFWAFTVSQQ